MGRETPGAAAGPARVQPIEDPIEPVGDAQVAEVLTALAVQLFRQLPRELSLTALGTLGDLQRFGPQRLTQLAQLEGVAQPSMTALVSRLEDEGLVVRRGDPADGRAVLVELTEAGEELLARRRRAGIEVLAGQIRKLPTDEATLLRRALGALRRLAEADLTARGHLVALPGQVQRTRTDEDDENDENDANREAP